MEQFSDYVAMGKKAFHNGESCFAPLDILLEDDNGIKKCDAWFKGWHAANLAAPIPGWSKADTAALEASRG
jgi:hypothetical protein